MSLSRRDIVSAALAGLGGIAAGKNRASETPGAHALSFHHDHILGTSLDVWLDVPDARILNAAERVVLDEIERLRRIFSLHDSQSELSRLNRSSGTLALSPDLFAVLDAFKTWNVRSSGACNPQLGELHALWTDAANSGCEPDSRSISLAARRASSSGWKLDPRNRSVERAGGAALDLNSIAKGYILQSVATRLRAQISEAASGLINLGGDMHHWGERPAWIGVQNPFAPEDNQPPCTMLRLENKSIATSGGYLRGYKIGERWRSHILDPRTGRPADGVASATVVAADSMTANVLATTLCVLPPTDGLRLIKNTSGAECLIVGRDGAEFRSDGFDEIETDNPEESPATNPSVPKPGEKKPDESKLWLADYQLKVSTSLPQPAGRARRPYVAVWIEDSKEKAVRTLVVWGNAPRWLPELSGWWKIARDDKALVAALTRATRGPGKYDIVWDGKDDRGKVLPQGTYTVKVEVHREHGRHVYQTGKIVCGAEEAKLTLEKNDETGETTVTYGKKVEPAK